MSKLTLLLFALAFVACNNSTDGKKDIKAEDKSVASETSKNVRNNISARPAGIKVEQAFLMFDDGKLVPEDNKVEVGQVVHLRLIVSGWKATDDKVVLGASEKIVTDEGQVVLDEQDLFANYPDGVNSKDAGIITLSATITRIDKLFKYFEVSFRVWDKNSSDNVSGSYRLYLK
ncbi:MAG TPA: hypothetical protein VJT83_06585 [Chitinophagaceae bacterium]|nr:hypothetical protein [Chitinophagaceae bacterium]